MLHTVSDGHRAARRRQVAFAIFGTLVAAVLVASLGDSSAHKAYLSEKKTQETQIAGSWTVDHKHMDSTGVKAKDENKADVKQFMKTEQQQQALSRLQAKHEADTIAKVYQGTQLQFYAGAKPENDDDSGIGDKKPADLFGEASGSSGNGYEPEFEPSDDADVGVAVSNFPGDYIAGTDSNDYSDDLEGRMVIHRGSVVAAQLDPDNADPVMKGYFDTANKKLNMPGIPGGQYP